MSYDGHDGLPAFGRALVAEAVADEERSREARRVESRIAEVRRLLDREDFACLCSREGRPITFGYRSGGHIEIWHAEVAVRHVYEPHAPPKKRRRP